MLRIREKAKFLFAGLQLGLNKTAINIIVVTKKFLFFHLNKAIKSF